MSEALIALATCAAMIALVPLMIWGGTGSWRHALHALKQYAGILLAFVLVGGGLGLAMAIAEHGFGVLMLPFR